MTAQPLHGAIAHGIGAGAAGRRNAAERGVRTGVNREKKSAVTQLFIERLSGNAGLDDAIEILRVHSENSVHVAEIDRNAANWRINMALERGPNPEGDYGHPIRRTDPHDLLNILGALRIDDRVRWLIGNPGDGVAMLLTHRLRGDDTVTEGGGELVTLSLLPRISGFLFDSGSAPTPCRCPLLVR